MKEQIVVVEGKNDVIRLKQVFKDINVVSVNGSAIKEDIVEMLISKQDTHEIIICTDPDYPGLKIRHELETRLTNVSHVFLERHKSFSRNRKKIGLEHLSNADIIEAFNNVLKQTSKTMSDVDLEFLYDAKLVGHENSKANREKIAKELNLGYVNGKTLLSRIKIFNITKDDIRNVL